MLFHGSVTYLDNSMVYKEQYDCIEAIDIDQACDHADAALRNAKPAAVIIFTEFHSV